MRILIIIFMFFILGALLVISNNNLAMYKQENVSEFSDLYMGWLNQLFLNSQKLTGEVVKMDWLPREVGEEEVGV